MVINYILYLWDACGSRVFQIIILAEKRQNNYLKCNCSLPSPRAFFSDGRRVGDEGLEYADYFLKLVICYLSTLTPTPLPKLGSVLGEGSEQLRYINSFITQILEAGSMARN